MRATPERSPVRDADAAETSTHSAVPVCAWVDIENPPQVQYLTPLVEGLQHRGIDVVVTARDYGDTFQLLDRRGVSYEPVGSHFGAAKVAKVTGSLRRALRLRTLARRAHASLAISASRSTAIAARSLGLPSFVLCDYEYVNLAAFRATRSYIVHPDVIHAESFTRRGVKQALLVPYPGIKEDITFADVDTEQVSRRSSADELDGDVKVLLRPPAEESHYHRAASSDSLLRVLGWFAACDDATVIYSPRYPWQASQLDAFEWRRPPVVLDGPVPFTSLYQSVDVVFSGGGTMLREAAYLGVPAVSLFQGGFGDVDRFLQSTGRLTHVESAADLEQLDLRRMTRRSPLRSNERAREDVLDAILGVAEGTSTATSRSGPRRSALR